VTFRAWLGRTIRELAAVPETPPPAPEPSSPESTPSSPTPSSRTSEPTSAEAAMLPLFMATMRDMQTEMMKEMRGMVMDILQGRERPPLSEEEQVVAERTRFDPPDFDAPGTEDLPAGIAGVFERQDQEEIEFRTSVPEGELYRQQLERLRQNAGMDPQGPSSAPTFSKDSIGLHLPTDPPEA
jgi:hypothetical protein